MPATLASAAPITELPTGQLQTTDVQNIIASAVTQAVHDKVNVVVAVVDREGNVLGVFDMNGAPPSSVDDVLGLFTPPT
ncbi:MAG TPA: heme-binding protein, partial [Candidatus Binataceae bacterium]|nr:heme-binding protein [Candidatus Binataceae bacterium]